ncbi:hypothetical protein XH93_09315 [Bradyrhizobium sp. CCBAU 51753]|nr:hypothetical protein XH93_09315 [Bradyrhizobium sp. CCBAU 51753]
MAESRCRRNVFLGDLDLAGIDIFLKLRELIPHLGVSALYSPMLIAVADAGTSHPHCALVEKLGQPDMYSSDRDVSRLAAACRLRAVDQEAVSNQDILQLADRVLE